MLKNEFINNYLQSFNDNETKAGQPFKYADAILLRY